LEEIVARELQAAKSEPARDLAKRKLMTIRLQLRGPVVEDKPESKQPAKAKPSPEQLEAIRAAAKQQAAQFRKEVRL